jgi:hypothetical protein
VPVHAIHVVRSGSTGRSFFVHAHTPSGEGVTGIDPELPGVAAAFVREGEPHARAIALTAGEPGTWVAGGFVEVDPRLLPGVYRVSLPDAMLAAGSPRAMLVLSLPGAVVEPLEVDLVAYDPQDETCIGMSQLSDERRHQFLRQALPRMTEMELELGRQAENELAQRSQPPG